MFRKTAYKFVLGKHGQNKLGKGHSHELNQLRNSTPSVWEESQKKDVLSLFLYTWIDLKQETPVSNKSCTI